MDYKKDQTNIVYNNTNYNRYYVNIDSKFRNNPNKLELEDIVQLKLNPLEFNKNSNLVIISHENHDLKKGDIITLSNVIPKNVILRTFIDENTPTFVINKNTNVLILNYEHNIPSNITKITVKLDGIKGDTNNNLLLGNIPINLINTTHDATIIDHNHISILLPINLYKDYTLKNYNFKLIFEDLAGIHTHKLNNTYYIIKNIINHNKYSIELDTNAFFDYIGGGPNVCVSKVSQINKFISSPNHYIINLTSVFHNVVSVKLVNTIIPHPGEIINNTNNAIYFNTLFDDNEFKKIVIPDGSYDMEKLERLITEKFLDFGYIAKTNISEKDMHLELFKEYNIKKIEKLNNLEYKIQQENTNIIYINQEVIIDNIICTVTNIIDEYNYIIKSHKELNNNSKILIPEFFKLKSDLFNITEYTKYNTKISCNNHKLFQNTYIFMIAEPLKNFISVTPVKNAFAKILLFGKPNSILYDSYVDIYTHYDKPLHELHALEITCCDKYGNPVDFHGLDHSFMLEIVTLKY